MPPLLWQIAACYNPDMDLYAIHQPSAVSWEDYRNLRLEALRLEPQAFGAVYQDQVKLADQEWQEKLVRIRENEGKWLLFAAHKGKLVGMVGAYREEPGEISKVRIISVFVKKEYRGKGIAKKLMWYLLDQLKRAEIQEAYLNVNINQEAAVCLYQSVGFNVVGHASYRMGDGLVHDEYVMKKILS